MDLPALGALGDGPEHDGRADFGSALLPGRRSFRPIGLFVADGGSECPPGPCYAAGSATSCGEAGCFFSLSKLSVLSLGFPRVPFCSLEASFAIAGKWDTPRRVGHSRRPETCGTGRGDRI